MLSLSGVTKQIGGLTAVNNVDLQIDADEIVGLVGPNGAGKTTLLNIISGILPPTAGTVTFNGEDITGLKADKICHRGIAKTFQIAKSFPDLSARQCVMIGVLFGNRQGTGMSEAKKQALEILTDVNFPQEKTETLIRNLMLLNSRACSSPGPLHAGQNCSSWTSSPPVSTRRRARRRSGSSGISGTGARPSSSSSMS
jgi:branched-chain amino acid transport system ATP-binding protein